MSSDLTARVFYCTDCGNRSRGLPMKVVITNVRVGPSRFLQVDLQLCPPCKVAWIDHHMYNRSPARRPMHEAFQRDARLRPADAEDLVEVQQWR